MTQQQTSAGSADYSESAKECFFNLLVMLRCQFTVDGALCQVLPDSDSEEEDMQLSSEAEADVSTDGESVHHSPQSAHGFADALPQYGQDGSSSQAGDAVELAGRLIIPQIWVNVAVMKILLPSQIWFILKIFLIYSMS